MQPLRIPILSLPAQPVPRPASLRQPRRPGANTPVALLHEIRSSPGGDLHHPSMTGNALPADQCRPHDRGLPDDLHVMRGKRRRLPAPRRTPTHPPVAAPAPRPAAPGGYRSPGTAPPLHPDLMGPHRPSQGFSRSTHPVAGCISVARGVMAGRGSRSFPATTPPTPRSTIWRSAGAGTH